MIHDTLSNIALGILVFWMLVASIVAVRLALAGRR